MLTALGDFAAELRATGIPVSMVEVLDAAAAVRHIDLADREALRAALAATMVKNARHERAFDTAFDVFFGLRPAPADVVEPGPGDEAGWSETAFGGAAGGAGSAEDMLDAIVAALATGDRAALLELVRLAVDRLSGFQPGRPVGGRYYLYRVMHRIDANRLRQMLLDLARSTVAENDDLGGRLAAEIAGDQVATFRDEVEDEILRRLVADRGADAVAKTLRSPLVDDIDLMHATREELEEIGARIAPLARKLASRLSARRRQGRRGRLDVRRTIRRSLAHGGALVDPRWRPRRVTKPELVLLCDVSGSMAMFARFTMQLTFAIGHQFSNVRSFAFIDGLDEVTSFLGPGTDFEDAMARVAAEAAVVQHDGHSDYGSALRLFAARHLDAVTQRSTVIVTGDARNNYRDSGLAVLGVIAERARALHWLNPEARRYWDTGDSIMSMYAPLCDGVHEVRTLRQLEGFVERVALGPRAMRSVVRTGGG